MRPPPPAVLPAPFPPLALISPAPAQRARFQEDTAARRRIPAGASPSARHQAIVPQLPPPHSGEWPRHRCSWAARCPKWWETQSSRSRARAHSHSQGVATPPVTGAGLRHSAPLAACLMAYPFLAPTSIIALEPIVRFPANRGTEPVEPRNSRWDWRSASTPVADHAIAEDIEICDPIVP